MKNKIYKSALLIVLVFVLAFKSAEPPIQVYLIGDSTVCEYPLSRSPLTGWGMPFATFFDSIVVVQNHAKGGRSTRTFLEENRWQPIYDELKAGDYVFIQFGHNDEAKEEIYKDRYTTPEDYLKNLEKFISETRSKGAIPILLTPVTRMKFDKDGIAQETHEEYAGLAKKVAVKTGVTFIDLNAESLKLLQEFGPDKSKLLFNQLEAGENPHYPNGIKDNTHFSELGARKMAEIVLRELRKQNIKLVDHVMKPVK
ncbi:MAG: rhamnogalacturonan acetylesterase [Pelobium sp.]